MGYGCLMVFKKVFKTHLHIQSTQNLTDMKMSSEGVWSGQTKCSVRVNQGQCPTNRCPQNSLIFAVQTFCSERSGKDPTVWWRTEGLPDISNKFRVLCFIYSSVCATLALMWHYRTVLKKKIQIQNRIPKKAHEYSKLPYRVVAGVLNMN